MLAPLLQHAVHALSRLALHAAAAMARMHGVHGAVHVGLQLLKVAQAFKSTAAAARAALGRGQGDPHRAYLMRQATNLAALLATLLASLRALEQDG